MSDRRGLWRRLTRIGLALAIGAVLSLPDFLGLRESRARVEDIEGTYVLAGAIGLVLTAALARLLAWGMDAGAETGPTAGTEQS